MSDTRLAFKAGRAFRREGTNWIDADPRKGAILLQNGEDGLLHFIWKNRSTNEVEEDLILFPTDATFEKVQQSAWGRTYVLKFSSSNQRHFFWMQDADTSRDREFTDNLNRLLADPEEVPVWSPAQPSTSSAPAVAGTSQPPAQQAAPAAGLDVTPEQLAQLRTLVASMAGSGGQAEPEVSLIDILTPANLSTLFATHPEVIQAIFPHLPPDLPTPPSQETLEQIIASPQFRAAVRNFDQALRTGLLGPVVRGLGLPEEAGTGVEAFLRAIQDQAQGEGEGASGDRMDTD
ncbi:adhesion regulating molecule [Obba rivulosa]|uniref:Adhesion regulating molecule n=1 Tax=Obba rivulosa TaxID=1052685 RepID=A0A8E2AUJ3_9APHY|nr:adhesion regulating molecule [Obba rivulosa]